MDNREIIPGWELVEKIGSGGFSTVYKIRKSRSAGSGEYCAALKVIKIPNTPDEYENYAQEGYDHNTITSIFENQVKKLEEEFRLMSRFKGNSNIVSYEDHMIIPHDDGKGWDIYIRMELLEPLMKHYNQKPLDEKETVKLGIDICRALEICQRFNVIHRDIKPQNIFVNDLGDYKLGDFGIARTMDHTTHATKIGTYTYIAPEVYRGDKYNSDVDIYSLGLVLYWLLNERRLPFLPLPPAVPNPTDISEATGKRLSGEVLPPPKNGSNELKQIVLKACAFNSADRYQSAMEMRMELEKEFIALSTPAFRQNRENAPYANMAQNQFARQMGNADSLGEWQPNTFEPNGNQQGIGKNQSQSAYQTNSYDKTMVGEKKQIDPASDFGVDKTMPVVLPHQGGNYSGAFANGGNNPNVGHINVANPNMGSRPSGNNNPNVGNGGSWQKTKSSHRFIATIITAIYVFFMIGVFSTEIVPAVLFFSALCIPITKLTSKLISTVYTNGQFKATIANGTLTISGSGEMPYCNDARTLPWYYEKEKIKVVIIDKGVRSIGNDYFYGFTSLKRVKISETVTQIGENAFCGCNSIKKINIPAFVTKIGKNAFCGCTLLTDATFGNPGGWIVSENGDASKELYVPISGSTINANYLKNIYCSFYWYKK